MTTRYAYRAMMSVQQDIHIIREPHGAFMTDEELKVELEQLGECSFTDLPEWMQHELQCRGLSFGPRPPTEAEKEEANEDDIEQRIRNPETVSDMMLKYGIKE